MNRKIIAVVSVLLVMSMLFAFAGCSSTKEEDTTTTTIAKKTPDLPTEQLYSVADSGETFYIDADGTVIDEASLTTLDDAGILDKNTRLLDYYKVNADALKDGKTSAVVTRSEKKSLGKQTDAEGNSVKFSENSKINAAIDGLKKYLLVNGDNTSTEYGPIKADDIPGGAAVCNLTINDVESSACVDGATTRTVVINLKSPVSQEIIDANFEKEDVNYVYTQLDQVSDYMTFNKEATKFTYSGCSVEVVTDITTDEVLSIKYIKGINVDTEITGVGTLEAVGTLPLHLFYTYTVTYSIDREAPAAEAK